MLTHLIVNTNYQEVTAVQFIILLTFVIYFPFYLVRP